MNIEDLQQLCKALPGVTEDIKWGHDLVFSIGGKMFCVAGLTEAPVSVSFKVPDEDFDELSSRKGFCPAPYVARYKWVLVDDLERITPAQWKKYISESYRLVFEKLPKKQQKQITG